MKKKAVWIAVLILTMVLFALVILYLFVFSVREIRIENLSEKDDYTFVRYVEDEQALLKIQVVKDKGSLASDQVRYTSSHPEVAEVSEEGTVTAKAAGTAVITVQAKSNPWVKAEVPVTVIQKALGMQIAMPEELPERYESGTINAPAIIGLGASVRKLHGLGCGKIRDHSRRHHPDGRMVSV